MSKSVLLFSILLSTLIVGCSSNKYKPPKKINNFSEARNIMYSGGMYTGFSDSRIPQEEYDSLTMKVLEGGVVAYAGTGLAVTALNGLFNWQSAALNLLFWSVAPKDHAARNSIVAFMPQSMAKDEIEARDLLRGKLTDAFVEALENHGGEIKDRTIANEGQTEVIVYFHKEWACSTNASNMCMVLINVMPPKKGLAPSHITEDELPVYAFTSKDRFMYNYFKFQTYDHTKKKVREGQSRKAPHDQILFEVGNLMDDWVFMYAAPGKTFLASGKANRVPMVFTKNKIEYFVLPKKS